MSQPDRRSFLRWGALAAAGIACSPTTTAPSPSPTPSPSPSPTDEPSPSPSDQPSPTDEPAAALRWRRVRTDRTPPARREYTLTEAFGSLYLFGGRASGTPLDDLWRFDGTNWERVAARGQAPSPRFGHNAGHLDGHLVVFGGQAGSELFNDSYVFLTDEQRWRRLAPSGSLPGIRYGAGSIAHGPTNSLLVSHGFNFSGRFDDTRALHVGQVRWRDRTPGGTLPVERCLHRCAPVGDDMLLFGGQTTGRSFLGDTWVYDVDGRRWREVSGRAPSDRNLCALAGTGDRAFLFGGFVSGGVEDDTWLFRNDRWRRLEPRGAIPPARGGIEGAIVGSGSDATMYVFGGSDGSRELDDLWSLNVGAA